MTQDELDAIPGDVLMEAAQWAAGHKEACAIARLIMENRALKAQLPEQVDPDLLAARKIGADYARRAMGNHEYAAEIEAGECDDHASVHLALSGIKHGREQSQ